MLAVTDISDWIEGIIVVLILAGSALGGFVKWITAKLNRSREEMEAGRELQHERPPPPRMMQRPDMPPMARPMPPRPRLSVTLHPSATRPLTPQPTPQRPMAEIPKSFQPVVQSILDVVLDGAVDIEDVFPKPQPRRDIPPLPPRAAKATGSKRPAKRRSIEEREEQKAKLVEKRIGHPTSPTPSSVGSRHNMPHVASATSPQAEVYAESFERPTRTDLRRAIILNEILSPPLALRGQP